MESADQADFGAQLAAYYVEAGMDNTPSEATQAVYWRRLERFDAPTVFRCMESIWNITVGAENGRGGRKLYTTQNRPTPAQLADYVQQIVAQRTRDAKKRSETEERRLLEAEIDSERGTHEQTIEVLKARITELAKRSKITTTQGSYDARGGYALSDLESRLHPNYCTVKWLENELGVLQKQTALGDAAVEEQRAAVRNVLGGGG